MCFVVLSENDLMILVIVEHSKARNFPWKKCKKMRPLCSQICAKFQGKLFSFGRNGCSMAETPANSDTKK